MVKLRDRVGERVGRLLVLRRADDHIQANGRRRVMWECRCVCGTKLLIEAGNLREGHSTSCGCLVKDNCASIGKTNLRHGRTKTREWLAWRGAKDRCFNPNTPQYKNYGARGIAVCARWKNSFERFLTDMGECPPKHTLERINVNGNYSPSNCKWATVKEQIRNRTCTPRIKYKGKLVPLVNICESKNIPYRLVYERIYRSGWPVDRALSTPKRIKNVQANVGL